MGVSNFTDLINIIDRLAGVGSAFQQGQIGRQVRVLRKGTELTMNDLADALRMYEVPVYWKRATDEYYIFNVRAGQWQWAVDNLFLAGANMNHRPRPWAIRWAAQSPGRMPVPWSKSRKGKAKRRAKTSRV